ncbi:MAG: rhomboid family intramembrane serine protease [Cyclobacteriaceae bacterium]
MNNSFLEDFKNAWGKPNNALAQIILINVIVFVFHGVLLVLSELSGFPELYDLVREQFSLPADLTAFLFRPWTILSYAFTHSMNRLLHILMNMLILYWFGKLIAEYLGSQKLISIYVLGALTGGLAYMVILNVFPYYSEMVPLAELVGASGAVYAVTVAAATLMPDYVFHLLIFGPVRIKYIAAVVIFMSFLGSVGGNAGGNIAHLGGAAMGFLYIRQLQAGNDLGQWVITWMTFFKSFFTKQSKIKVTHKTSRKSSRSARSSTSGASASSVDQVEIDAILDKISKSGYESLSKSEKQKLFNASKK